MQTERNSKEKVENNTAYIQLQLPTKQTKSIGKTLLSWTASWIENAEDDEMLNTLCLLEEM